MKRVLLAAAAFACAARAGAVECNDSGREETRTVCDHQNGKYNPRACRARIADHRRDCSGRRQEAERNLAEARRKGDRANIEKIEERLRDIDAFVTKDLPVYESTIQKFPESPVRDGTRPGSDGGGGGLGGGGDQPQGEGSSDPNVQAAEQALRAGDYRGAEEAATRAIEANPSSPEAYGARMKARTAAGDKRGAQADARRVLELEPKPELGAAALSIIGNQEELAQAASRLKGQKLRFQDRSPDRGFGGGKPSQPGRTMDRLGREGAAAAGFDSAAAAGAAGPGAFGSTADPKQVAAAAAALPAAAGGPKNEAADRAYKKLVLRDFSGAYDDATKAIAERPADARARTLRAAAANRLGRHDQALEDADAALALKPKDVTALLERGYAKYKLGRYLDALGDVDEALLEDPKNAIGYLYRGMILEKLSRVSDSMTAYFKAAELDPGLLPVAEDAKARMQGGPAPGSAASPSRALLARAAARWKLWALLLAAAAALLAFGLRRAARPGWGDPVTPAP